MYRFGDFMKEIEKLLKSLESFIKIIIISCIRHSTSEKVSDAGGVFELTAAS